MLGAGQCPYPLVSAIPRDNPREGAPRQKIHELSEKRLANVHGRLLGYPRKVPDRVQIDTTQKRQKTTENQNAMGRQPSLSRTDVPCDENGKVSAYRAKLKVSLKYEGKN